MVSPDGDHRWFPLHGVVASAELRGIEENAENLDIMLGHDASNDHSRDKETNSSDQRVQHGEDRAPVISATKNNRRSAPNTVSGRFIALKTLFLRASRCEPPSAMCDLLSVYPSLGCG
jgi:hypothetical protein